MIAFKYTKTDGAEYLSHLDLLRHIDRSLKRAGLKVKTSEGFNPHPKIFMNSPLGLGIKSVAEYCAVDCAFTKDFKDLFNASSPSGVKCIDFKEIPENPNYAHTIKSCLYSAEGLTNFD
ncbi:MAG: TIGR03936 family radical SAM-associated protein, partial [Clostridia bacterium]|nr:TIGR03936 family radical SAM-associated protein [Clostridia bacterium]